MTPKKIKKLRMDRSWSTADLAQEVGVSRRTVEGWMQGRPMSKPVKIMMRILMNKEPLDIEELIRKDCADVLAANVDGLLKGNGCR